MKSILDLQSFKKNNSIKDFPVQKSDLKSFDLLNRNHHSFALSLSMFLVRNYPENGGTKRVKQALLYNSFYILSQKSNNLTYEEILQYFSNELYFTETNLRIVNQENFNDDNYLREILMEMLSIPFQDFCYLLKEDIQELYTMSDLFISQNASN